MKRLCGFCKAPLVKKPDEPDKRFARRLYCSRKCCQDQANYQAKIRSATYAAA